MTNPAPTEDLLKLAECPECLELTRGRILICPEGHLVCAGCFSHQTPLAGLPVRSTLRGAVSSFQVERAFVTD